MLEPGYPLLGLGQWTWTIKASILKNSRFTIATVCIALHVFSFDLVKA